MANAAIPMKFKGAKRRIAANGTVKFFSRVFIEFGEDNGTNLAAAVAYYAFISLFPLLLAALGLAGLLLQSKGLQDNLVSYVGNALPGSKDSLLNNVQSVINARGALGVIGILGFLWTGSALMAAVGRAVNVSWNIHREMPFYLKKLRDIGLTILLGALFTLSLGVSATLAVGPTSRIPVLGNVLAQAAAIIVALVLTFALFSVLFKVLPNTKTYWRHIWAGALLTAVLFEIGRTAAFLYLTQYSNYKAVYGSLASAIVLLVWLFYSAVIMVLGAEITSEYSRMRRGVGRGIHSHSNAKPA